MEFAETEKGNVSLVLEGYCYRKRRQNKDNSVVWQCVKEKHGCKGKLVCLGDQVLSSFEHACVQDEVAADVRVAVSKLRKRAREDLKTPISQLFKEELEPLRNKGPELAAELPQLKNIKGALYSRRRKGKDDSQNLTAAKPELNPLLSTDPNVVRQYMEAQQHIQDICLRGPGLKPKEVLIAAMAVASESVSNCINHWKPFFMRFIRECLSTAIVLEDGSRTAKTITAPSDKSNVCDEGVVKEELILEDFGDPNEFTEYQPLKEDGENEATKEEPKAQVSALPSTGTGSPSFETVICGTSDIKIKQEIFQDESDSFRSLHKVEQTPNWFAPAEPHPSELLQCVLPVNFDSPNVLPRTTSQVRPPQNQSSKQSSTWPKLKRPEKLLETSPALGLSGSSSFHPATETSNEYIHGHFSQSQFCAVETIGLCETTTVASTSTCNAATTAGYNAESTPSLNVANSSDQPPHWVPPYVPAGDDFDGIFVSLRSIPVESRKATRDKILELVKFISLENVNPALVNFSVIK